MVPKKLSQKKFNCIYSQVPRLGVEIILKTKDGVLLTKRLIPPSKGMWHFPGGSILFNETLKQAVKRTAKEEINLNVKIVKLLGVIEFPQKKEVFGHPISLAFLVKRKSGKIKGSWQADEIKFFKKPPKNIHSAHKKFIEKYLMK